VSIRLAQTELDVFPGEFHKFFRYESVLVRKNFKKGEGGGMSPLVSQEEENLLFFLRQPMDQLDKSWNMTGTAGSLSSLLALFFDFLESDKDVPGFHYNMNLTGSRDGFSDSDWLKASSSSSDSAFSNSSFLMFVLPDQIPISSMSVSSLMTMTGTVVPVRFEVVDEMRK